MNYNLNLITPYIISDRVFNDKMAYLDWNESFQLPSKIEKQIKKEIKNFNLYPDPNNTLLRSKLENYTKVNEKYIEIFNGSDSALDITFRALINPRDVVLIPFPNYTQINQTIQSLGGLIKYTKIEEFETQLSKIKPKVVYLSNPNNPIGYSLNLESIIDNFSNIYFIVDEAYHEYSKKNSVFEKAHKLNNLIVTRTFSKGLSLAGLRLGYLSSNENILNGIRSLKNFKQVSSVSEIAGAIVLDNIKLIDEKIKTTISVREYFKKSLVGYDVFESQTNFLLIKHNNSLQIIKQLKENNILVRDRNEFIKNSFRITIGDKEIMDRVLTILNE